HKALNTRAALYDAAANFDPRCERRVRRRWVIAAAAHGIDKVHADRFSLDQHLAFAGLRPRNLFQLHDLGRTMLSAHHGGNRHGRLLPSKLARRQTAWAITHSDRRSEERRVGKASR